MDIADITETAYGSESTDGEVETVTVTLRLAGETEGADQRDAEMWGHYGLAYRPATPDGEKKCQALIEDIAGARAVVATRDTRAADAAGALNEGDVAVWSVGKNALRLNADKSVSIIQQGESTDAFISIEKDGKILIGNQWGQLEIGPNGLVWTGADGIAVQAGGGAFQAIAPTVALQGGTIALGVGASTPLCVAPITGTSGAGFVSTKPIPNIFV